MCPSFRATGDEKDSTRGRARVLQEMIARRPDHRRLALDGGPRGAGPVPGLQGLLSGTARSAWTWPPTRPNSCTTTTGAASGPPRTTPWAGCPRLPALAGARPAGQRADARRLGEVTPASPGSPGTAVAAVRVPSRTAPRVARTADGARRRGAVRGHLHQGVPPAVAGATARVLAAAGHVPEPRTGVCCGLTWMSTGQLSAGAQAVMRSHRRAALDGGPTARSSCRSRAARPRCARTCRNCWARRRPHGSRPGAQVPRRAHRLAPGLAACRRCRTGSCCRPTATSTRRCGRTPVPTCCADRGARRCARPPGAAAWRATSASRRALRRRMTVAELALAPALDGRPDAVVARRRVQLPHCRSGTSRHRRATPCTSRELLDPEGDP